MGRAGLGGSDTRLGRGQGLLDGLYRRLGVCWCSLTAGEYRDPRCPAFAFPPACSTGTLPADEELARWLRKTVVGPGAAGPAARSCAVLLAANKCERRGGGGAAAVAAAVAESMRLGLGEPVALSAMTGEGMTDLYAALQPLLDPLTEARRAAVQQIEAPSGSGSTDIAGYSSSDGSDGISGMAAAAAPRGLGGQGAAVQQQAGGGEWGKEDPKTSNSGGGSSVPLRIAIMGLPNVVSVCPPACGRYSLTACTLGMHPGLPAPAGLPRLGPHGGGPLPSSLPTLAWKATPAKRCSMALRVPPPLPPHRASPLWPTGCLGRSGA